MSGEHGSLTAETVALLRQRVGEILAGPGSTVVVELLKLLTKVGNECVESGRAHGFAEGSGVAEMRQRAHAVHVALAFDLDVTAAALLESLEPTNPEHAARAAKIVALHDEIAANFDAPDRAEKLKGLRALEEEHAHHEAHARRTRPNEPSRDKRLALLRAAILDAMVRQRDLDLAILDEESDLRARIAGQCADLHAAAQSGHNLIKLLYARIAEGVLPMALGPKQAPIQRAVPATKPKKKART